MRTQEEYLEGIACTSVDYAKTSVRSWSVEDCEYVLKKFPALGKSMRKVFEVQARRAFGLKTRGEEVQGALASAISKGATSLASSANYSTLRKALYLAGQKGASDETLQEIRDSIKARFPWGRVK
jgi:hypothetical protein